MLTLVIKFLIKIGPTTLFRVIMLKFDNLRQCPNYILKWIYIWSWFRIRNRNFWCFSLVKCVFLVEDFLCRKKGHTCFFLLFGGKHNFGNLFWTFLYRTRCYQRISEQHTQLDNFPIGLLPKFRWVRWEITTDIFQGSKVVEGKFRLCYKNCFDCLIFLRKKLTKNVSYIKKILPIPSGNSWTGDLIKLLGDPDSFWDLI